MLMQNVEVFEQAFEHTSGDDLAHHTGLTEITLISSHLTIKMTQIE